MTYLDRILGSLAWAGAGACALTGCSGGDKRGDDGFSSMAAVTMPVDESSSESSAAAESSGGTTEAASTGEPGTSGTTHVLTCGDGIVEGDEECDDGDQDDDDECLGNCVAARCGDGVVQTDVEVCDDGDDDDSDECLSTCEAASCGDGVVQAGVEECDDGNVEYMVQFGACCSNSLFYVS